MKNDNIVKEKSLAFAVRIVKMVKYLVKNTPYAEQPILSQILKSGTSIGANIREAEHAESREDFIHKLKVALKEANETEFWLEVLHEADYLDNQPYESLMEDCKELNKILITIVRKTNN